MLLGNSASTQGTVLKDLHTKGTDRKCLILVDLRGHFQSQNWGQSFKILLTGEIGVSIRLEIILLTINC